MTVTPRQIVEAAADRIEALDASAHAQGAVVTPSWKLSKTPLRLGSKSKYGHLSFNVFIDDHPVQPAFDRLWEGGVAVSPRLVVQFVYGLPANGAPDAEALSWDAALDVARVLLDDWSTGPAGVLEGVETRLENLGRPQLALGGDQLLITQAYVCTFDLPVRP